MSFVSLGEFIPKYFILFVVMVNRIVSLISLSVFFIVSPQQYSCIENSMVRGAWWATVQGLTKSRTGLGD